MTRRACRALLACGLLVTACSASPGATDGSLTAQPSATSASAEPSVSGAPSADAPVAFTLVASHDPTTIPGLDLAGYITFGPDGLYVPSASEVLVLDATGSVVRRWGEPGSGPGQFGFLRDPSTPDSALGGVAVAADGTVFVVEAGNKRLQRFSATGEWQLSWGSPGSGNGQFLDPIMVAVAPSGEVLVVDDERDDIQVFSHDGAYLRTIGRQGTGDGQLRFTGAIRIGPDGTLVNADFGNSRVQAWDAGGAFLWSIGSEGTGPGEFVEPQDVAFGPDGSMFVVDGSRVQVFDGDMRLVGTWPDEPSPDHLASIAFDGETLWVLAPYIDTLFKIAVSGL